MFQSVGGAKKVSWKLCEFVAGDIILSPSILVSISTTYQRAPLISSMWFTKRRVSKDTRSLQQTWILNCHVLSLQEQYIISFCVGFSWGPSAPNCSPSNKAPQIVLCSKLLLFLPRLLEHLGPPAEQQETGSLEMTQRQQCGFPFLCGQNPPKKCGTWPCEK